MTEPTLRDALERLHDSGHQPMYNGRPSCPFCENFVDDEETHKPSCVLCVALAATPPALDREALREAAEAVVNVWAEGRADDMLPAIERLITALSTGAKP